MLKLSIIGQDTLAAAIATCCARHFDVTRMPDHGADVWWIAYDTPIGHDDKPDGDWVIDRIRELLVDCTARPIILVSSQMPVGTTAALDREFPGFQFAHSPENIRVATAINDFENQARVIVGIRSTTDAAIFEELFAPFTKQLIVTTPETAEAAKHFLNGLLALTIVYANEMKRLCAVMGADPDKVSLALRTDQRFSVKTPLRPGAPYGGGHLARDVWTLNDIAKRHGVNVPVISQIKASNEVV